MRSLSKLRLTFVGLALVACGGSEAEWSQLRDALARTPTDVRALHLASQRQRVSEAVGPLPERPTDGLSAVRALDRIRANLGVDAWVGGQLDLGESTASRGCSPLVGSDGTFSANTLEEWLASCPTPPTSDPMQIVVPGMPTLAAWVPSERRVYVHPALSSQLALGVSARGVVAGGSNCLSEVEQYCLRCPTGDGAGCEPLFGPGTQPVACSSLDAAAPPIFPGQAPQWRSHYCAWRAVVSEPWVRLHLLEASFPSFESGCWNPATTVVDLPSLMTAIPNASGDCATRLASALQAAADETELVLGAPFTPGSGGPYQPWPLRRCADYLEHVQCAACTPDPEGECVGFFTSSSGAGDCFDLRRSESRGGGFAAMCAWDYNLSFIQRECVNLYENCYDGRFYAQNAKSYENLVAAFPGFFDPERRDRCIDQWQACHDQNPYHDLDPSKPVPTPSTPTTPEEDSKCPG